LLSVSLIGVLYLGIGIVIGRLWRSSSSPRDDASSELRSIRETLLREGNRDLFYQLETLLKLRDRSVASLTDDHRRWIESFRSCIGQVIEVVSRSQEELNRMASVVEEKPSELIDIDAAGLATEAWFPAIAKQSDRAGSELRRTRRFPFDRLQSIAPTLNDEIPDDSEFFEVRFRDISTGGFSFIVPEPLASARIVARLGEPPYVVSVLAEVTHQRELWYDGAWVNQVGCQILQRLSGTAAEQSSETALLD
jgi:hypothetical protein